jgi:hypothetical protein
VILANPNRCAKRAR